MLQLLEEGSDGNMTVNPIYAPEDIRRALIGWPRCRQPDCGAWLRLVGKHSNGYPIAECERGHRGQSHAATQWLKALREAVEGGKPELLGPLCPMCGRSGQDEQERSGS